MRSPLAVLGATRRRVLLHRRGLAAFLVALAAVLALRSVSAPPPTTVAVWTAAHDLGAGTVLGPGDLVRVGFTPASVPRGRIDSIARARGRLLATPVRRGEPLTDVRLLGRGLLERYPGRTAAPVRLVDAAVLDLLRVGDSVDLIAADPQGQTQGRLLADDARVVAIPRVSADRQAEATGGVVVLAVPTTLATEVAAAGLSGFLTVTMNH